MSMVWEEDGIVDWVKGCAYVIKDEDGKEAEVYPEEFIVCDFSHLVES